LGIICQKTLIINIQYKIKEIFKMAKFNLSDAAKSILLDEGAKENLDSSVSSKRGGQDKPQRLQATVQGDVGKIGDSPNDVNDPVPDYTKGVPSAKPPGATPPVGQQPMPKLSPQPANDKAGDTGSSDMGGHQGSENSYDSIRDRIKAKLAKQTMQPNPGAMTPYVPEEVESDDEEFFEEEEGSMQEAEYKGVRPVSNAFTQTAPYPSFKKKKPASKEVAKVADTMKKETMKEKMKEDMHALLGDENLSEEFVSKATTIFEAAVIFRTESILEDIQNELVEQFEEAVEEIKEDLASKVDDYMNYMAEEWMKENELAVEKGLRAEIVEDFITGLKGLFEDHYIDIPEEKVNVVEELTTRVEELEESLNEQINASIQLKKELNEKVKSEAIHAVCEGLTQTQVEKMKALAESVDFTTMDEYVDKVVTLRESYFENQVKSADSSALNEEITVEEEKKTSVSTDPAIAQYAQSISKSLVK
jgi:hypothetical protein